eukprot:1015481-Pleurochrysis_carterae.AAC.2
MGVVQAIHTHRGGRKAADNQLYSSGGDAAAALAGRSSNQVVLCSGGGGRGCRCAASTGVGTVAAAGTAG